MNSLDAYMPTPEQLETWANEVDQRFCKFYKSVIEEPEEAAEPEPAGAEK